ncbi:GPW/gp25 family protein [Paraburkholderia sp. BR10936]|uniref:GPW/gp25 family protein n=1 Tax=Paraburkholderia sp. BR10936 TaxID=3236993 RepID=UPI0034D2BA9E
MNGTNANTGKWLSDIDHLRQSITDILTTPLGTRVMRRDYGSRLFELIDAPMNSETVMELYVATAQALNQWEPRFQVSQVKASSATPGQITLDLVGIYVPTGQPVSLSGIKVS